MSKAINRSKGPGIRIIPPAYLALFFSSGMYIQKNVILDDMLFQLQFTKVLGVVFFASGVFLLFTSVRQFIINRTTLLLIRPASSLQTTGLYAITRNPMYLGMCLMYFASTCIQGNWWHVILFPFLFLILQEHIIKREERYLSLEFGEEYADYRRRVRRWL
jgi:protein-S-isoprenylcysteine O-methyltransferase Ste14